MAFTRQQSRGCTPEANRGLWKPNLIQLGFVKLEETLERINNSNDYDNVGEENIPVDAVVMVVHGVPSDLDRYPVTAGRRGNAAGPAAEVAHGRFMLTAVTAERSFLRRPPCLFRQPLLGVADTFTDGELAAIHTKAKVATGSINGNVVVVLLEDGGRDIFHHGVKFDSRWDKICPIAMK